LRARGRPTNLCFIFKRHKRGPPKVIAGRSTNTRLGAVNEKSSGCEGPAPNWVDTFAKSGTGRQGTIRRMEGGGVSAS